jgi:hypothetical protein
MMDEGAPFCDICKAYHTFPHTEIDMAQINGETFDATKARKEAPDFKRPIEFGGSVITKVYPTFKPASLFLKTEDDAEGETCGPLFYQSDGGMTPQTDPVYLDLKMPNPHSRYKFFPMWFTYKQAKRIAEAMNLPLEVH